MGSWELRQAEMWPQSQRTYLGTYLSARLLQVSTLSIEFPYLYTYRSW